MTKIFHSALLKQADAEGEAWLAQYRRKKTPRVGYHQTELENLRSIAKKGLIPNYPHNDEETFGVYLNDALYPVGHPDAMETLGDDITLLARVPKTPCWDDGEVRELTRTPGGPDDNIGVGTAFFIKVPIPPKDLFVIEPKTRKQIPIQEYIKRPSTGKEASDEMVPRSKYDKVCHAIATDDELWDYFCDYVQCADAFENRPAEAKKVVDLVKSLTPFYPPSKRLYRGETIRMGDSRLPAKWEPHLRDLLSWSTNYSTARQFAEGRGIVWRTVGKIQGIALEDIVRWRNWTHPKESNYSGMQSEWFVLNTCKAEEAPFERTAKSASGVLYHVTHTKYIPAIKKKGIIGMQTSNWVHAEDQERYGQGMVFAFDTPEDAVRWAARMDWEFNKGMGTGKISIIKFTREGEWEIDDADPLSQASSKGHWLKSYNRVKPEQILSVTPLTAEMSKALVAGNPTNL